MSQFPITFDKPKTSPDIPWQLVGSGKTTKLRRVKVPGGWLYNIGGAGASGLAFVSAADVLQDPTVSDEEKVKLGLIAASKA